MGTRVGNNVSNCGVGAGTGGLVGRGDGSDVGDCVGIGLGKYDDVDVGSCVGTNVARPEGSGAGRLVVSAGIDVNI